MKIILIKQRSNDVEWKIMFKAETIAHVVKELESISQKYDEIAQNLEKLAIKLLQ